MLKSKKGIIVIILVAIIAIVGLVILLNSLNDNEKINNDNERTSNIASYEKYVQVMQNETKINVSDKFLETKTYDGLEIANISLKFEKGISTFIAQITNKTGKTKKEQKVTIILEDETGKQIDTLKGIIDETSPNETVTLNISVTKDIVNAYNFRGVRR